MLVDDESPMVALGAGNTRARELIHSGYSEVVVLRTNRLRLSTGLSQKARTFGMYRQYSLHLTCWHS
jgi:hypothetical protein